MSKIINAITALAEPVIEKHGCELWEIEYVKEAGTRYLRVFIDHPDGVSIDMCEAVSRELDPILDEHESIIPESYIFEVSSAGAERRLRGPSDFKRFEGSLAEVRLYKSRDGLKSMIGSLVAWDDNSLTLEISGKGHSFLNSEVAGVRLRVF